MRLFLFFFIFGFMANPIMAKPLGKATFLAVGEGLALDIEGKGAIVDAQVKRVGNVVSGSFSVTLSEFKTDNKLRDEHLCKTLECSKYPKATFWLEPITMSDGQTPFRGNLELHGQKKPFWGTAQFKGSSVSISAKLRLSDYGITPPEYKLARVNNTVEVNVELGL